MRARRSPILSAGILSAGLPLLAGATIVASCAALAAEAWWGLELLTHFRAQYLVVQMLVFVPLLARRRLRWCFALAACGVLNALPLVPYLPLPGAAVADSTAADSVSIMSVNVEADNVHHERLLEIVAREEPDVLLVVELTEAWEVRLRPLSARYPHRLMLPATDAYGLGLLSRYPFERIAPLALETTAAIDARIASPAGTFRLLGVHLRSPTSQGRAEERNRQLQRLVAVRAETEAPLVVVGDFNITPYSPHFAQWLLETGLRDARAGRGPGLTWPTFLPIAGIPIDHCVVSPEFAVVDFRRLPRFGSDHYPVLAELTLESGA